MEGFSANQTTPQLFLKRASLRPGSVAMWEKQFGVWTEVTWQQYMQHVEHLALGLVSLGLEKGDKVCVHGENSQEWLYADLAIQAVGGVSVGIYPTNPAAEVKYIAGHSDTKVYFAQDQEQTDKILAVKHDLPGLVKIVTWDLRGMRDYRDPMLMSFKEVEQLGRELKERSPGLFRELIASGQSDDEALIIYTSGTTGPPKGAVHTHRSFLTGAKALMEFFGVSERDRFLSYLPLCHAAERLFSVYMPLFSGSVICFAESTQTVQRDLAEVYPTFAALMPRILEKMRAAIEVKIDESTFLKKVLYKMFLKGGQEIFDKRMRREGFSFYWKMLQFIAYWGLFRYLQDKLGLLNVRHCVCGGAAVAPELIRYFQSIGVPVVQVYGQTEGLIIFAPRLEEMKPETLGPKPFKGVEWRLASDGEIQWKWAGNFKEYYKDEATTRNTLDTDGWLRSGDIGEIDEDGHLRIIDRKKNIIITSGGKNITPEYIENKIKASPYIADAIIIGEARPYLVALIQIEFDVMSHWAESERIPFTTLRDLSRNQAVIDMVAEIIKEANQEVSSVEQVKKFRLIDVNLDHETGELTATMKVKRSVVERKFAKEIAEMYGR